MSTEPSSRPRVQLRPLQRPDLVEAQQVFEDTPAYHRAVLGREAPSDIARRCLEQEPPRPKKGVRVFKRMLGIQRVTGHAPERVDPALVGLFDLFVGYPAYHIATIGTLLIREPLQRKGYGTVALDALIGWLREHHPVVEWLDASITDDNLAATRFLLKNGFDRTDSWHEVEVAGQPRRVIRLERKLT